MKILVFCQYYYPEPFRISEICAELVQNGNEVTVITGLPNYPEGKILKEYKFFRKRKEIKDGVTIKRSWEIGRRRGKIFLILNYISYAISASFRALFMREKYDVVFSYQLSPITMVYPAIVYATNKKVPLFLYCLDIWPESAKAHVNNDQGKLYGYVKKISRKIYNQCDKIAVTSEPFIEYLEKTNNVEHSKICYIPQHAESKLLNCDLAAEKDDVIKFMYAGNLGKGQNIETIIKAVGVLNRRNDFLVHIVGDGSNLEVLRDLAQREKVSDKILFHGRHPEEEMYKYFKIADALLITLRGNNFVSHTMPGKLQSYMTTGKPIFGAINGAAQEVVKAAQCGACVSSGDYFGLAKLMEDYINNPGKYEKCGQNAKEYFLNNFTKDIFMGRLQSEFNKILEKQK